MDTLALEFSRANLAERRNENVAAQTRDDFTILIDKRRSKVSVTWVTPKENSSMEQPVRTKKGGTQLEEIYDRKMRWHLDR